MTHPDAYHSLLLDCAVGAASPAAAALFAAHVRMRPEALALAQLADDVGGALLEAAAPAPAGSPGWPIADRDKPPAHAKTRGEIDAAIAGAPMRWSWRPWARLRRLPTPGLSLIKLPAGGAMPTHGHGGEELTLVLRGAFEDEFGLYGPGDIAFAEPGDVHAPRVIGEHDCVCLIADVGGQRFLEPHLRAAFGGLF